MSPSEPAPIRSSPAGEVTSLSLLARIRQNDSDAWSRLTKLYHPLVVYWCQRLGVAPSDIDDVVQEVFHAASTSLASFRKEEQGDTFRGWLRGITRNTALMHFRKEGRQPHAVGGTVAHLQMQGVSDPQASSLGGSDEETPSQLSELYHRALELVRAEFEGNTWNAFWRVVVEGQSPAIVAEQMGVSSAAIRQAKSRILRRLKQEVGELLQ